MFYLNFVRLCNSIGKSPSAAAEEMGFQRSVVTRWSNGSVPRKATIEKIATYFGVDSSELTGGEQKEKPSAPEGDGLDQLLKDCEGLSKDEVEEARRYVAYLKAKRNGI